MAGTALVMKTKGTCPMSQFNSSKEAHFSQFDFLYKSLQFQLMAATCLLHTVPLRSGDQVLFVKSIFIPTQQQPNSELYHLTKTFHWFHIHSVFWDFVEFTGALQYRVRIGRLMRLD